MTAWSARLPILLEVSCQHRMFRHQDQKVLSINTGPVFFLYATHATTQRNAERIFVIARQIGKRGNSRRSEEPPRFLDAGAASQICPPRPKGQARFKGWGFPLDTPKARPQITRAKYKRQQEGLDRERFWLRRRGSSRLAMRKIRLGVRRERGRQRIVARSPAQATSDPDTPTAAAGSSDALVHEAKGG